MDLTNGTPAQIKEYKESWLMYAFKVNVDKSLDVQGKVWCRRNVENWNWSFDVNEDFYVFLFHFECDANKFKNDLKIS